MADPGELLERAAEILSEDGWCQNSLHTVDGRHCMYGAVQKAANAPAMKLLPNVNLLVAPYINQAVDGLLPSAENYWAENADPGVRFNDHKSTTKEDVVLVLKRAAELARADT